MASVLEHYKNIGLKPTAELSEENVKASYKKAMRLWHPDVTSAEESVAKKKFNLAQEAYNELMFLIKKQNGQVPDTILNARAFFDAMGFDELAKTTAESIVEVNLERAATGVSCDAPGVSSMIDSKLMKKLILWARGLEITSNIKIFDTNGHFTSRAIDNILEVAMHYESATPLERKKSYIRFEQHRDGSFGLGSGQEYRSEEDPREVRMGKIIHDWVSDTYIRTKSFGWVHRTKMKHVIAKTKDKLKSLLAVLGVNESSSNDLLHSLEVGDIETALGGLEKLKASYKQKIKKDGDLAPESKKKATQLKKQIEKELSSLAKKASLTQAALLKDASLDKPESPVVDLFKDRITELGETLDRLRAQLDVSSGQKNLENISKLVVQIKDLDGMRG